MARHYRGGLAVAALVSSLLALRFTLFAGALYESRVVLMNSAQGAEKQRESLALRVRRALPELAADDRAGSLFLLEESRARLLLACRAEHAFAAHQRCATLASRALRVLPELRIVQPATLPAAPLQKPASTYAVVLLGSLVFGLLSGGLWMLGMAALPSSRRRSTARSIAPRPTTAWPPSRVLTVTSPRADRERPATQAASEPPSERVGLHAIEVERGWAAAPSPLLSDAPRELTELCDQLYVAAAQQCFVVGVTSFDGERSAKSRLAAQLAQLLARSEHARVLLLELDFHFANVDRIMQLEMPPRSGFSQQLHTRLVGGERTAFTVLRCTPHLSVLAEGRVRTPGMLHAYPVASALRALRQHFDIIVADGPTCEIDADRRVFGEVVDGVVFVAPSHESDADALALASPRFAQGQLLAVIA